MNSRPPAWGSRPSPSFSPGPANARLPNGNQQPAGAFPPLVNGARPSDANPHARILQQISGLTVRLLFSCNLSVASRAATGLFA